MRTLTIKVQNEDEFWQEEHKAAQRIDANRGYQGEVQSFASLPLLLEAFSTKRWELIVLLRQLGPSTLRGLARALGRDVKRVHDDAKALLEEGIIERDGDKKLFVPFKHIRIEADLFGDTDEPAPIAAE